MERIKWHFYGERHKKTKSNKFLLIGVEHCIKKNEVVSTPSNKIQINYTEEHNKGPKQGV